MINPIDASARGIQDGDMTEIFNDRGRMHIKAKVTERVLPGVIAVPQGAWRESMKRGSILVAVLIHSPHSSLPLSLKEIRNILT